MEVSLISLCFLVKVEGKSVSQKVPRTNATGWLCILSIRNSCLSPKKFRCTRKRIPPRICAELHDVYRCPTSFEAPKDGRSRESTNSYRHDSRNDTRCSAAHTISRCRYWRTGERSCLRTVVATIAEESVIAVEHTVGTHESRRSPTLSILQPLWRRQWRVLARRGDQEVLRWDSDNR